MRTHADGDLYRLRVTTTYPNGSTGESLLGPWSTLGAARAQRTRLLRDHHRFTAWGRPPRPEPVVVVERCVPAWEPVPDPTPSTTGEPA